MLPGGDFSETRRNGMLRGGEDNAAKDFFAGVTARGRRKRAEEHELF